MIIFFLLPFVIAVSIQEHLDAVHRDVDVVSHAWRHLLDQARETPTCNELFHTPQVRKFENQALIDLTNTFLYIGHSRDTPTECLAIMFQVFWYYEVRMKINQELFPVPEDGQSYAEYTLGNNFQKNIDYFLSSLLWKGVFRYENAKFTLVSLMSSFNKLVELVYSYGYDENERQQLVDGYLKGSKRIFRPEEKYLAILEVSKVQLDISVIRKIYQSMDNEEVAKYEQFLQYLVLQDASYAPQMLVQLIVFKYDFQVTGSPVVQQLRTSLSNYMSSLNVESRDMTYMITEFVLQYQSQVFGHYLEWLLINLVKHFESSILYSSKLRSVIEFFVKSVKLLSKYIDVHFLYQNSPPQIKDTCKLLGQNLIVDEDGWQRYEWLIKQHRQSS